MEETLRYRSQQLTVELKGLKRAMEQLSSAARELLLTEDELAAEYEGHPPRASALQVLEDRADEQLSWLTIDREQGRPASWRDKVRSPNWRRSGSPTAEIQRRAG